MAVEPVINPGRSLSRIPISPAERRLHQWLAGFERDTTEDVGAVITRARPVITRPIMTW